MGTTAAKTETGAAPSSGPGVLKTDKPTSRETTPTEATKQKSTSRA
jgi:hypothetical protein